MKSTYKKPEVYEHKDGYVARLYGKSSMSVYFDGKEVLHTGFRNVNTEDEVMELLADMPEFFKAIWWANIKAGEIEWDGNIHMHK